MEFFDRRFYSPDGCGITVPDLTDLKGVIVYPAPFPCSDAGILIDLLQSIKYKTSVHFVVDHTGVYQLTDMKLQCTHSGTDIGNGCCIAIMLVEPATTSAAEFVTKKNQTLSNLRTFLSAPWFTGLEIMSVGGAVAQGVIKEDVIAFYEEHAHYFMNSLLGQSYEQQCSFGSQILDRVADTSVRVNTLVEQASAELDVPENTTPVMQPGLFTGGCLYKTRGASTKVTSTGDMHLVAVLNKSTQNSKHPYEVMFLNGQRCWVNKTAIKLSLT